MTCQECEIKLGMGEDAAEHLASCEECCALAEELRLNSVALRGMRARPVMRWVLAAAAGVVIAIGGWWTSAVKPPERAAAANIGGPTRQETVVAPVAKVKHRPARKREIAQPLRVKMFTSDPDVVIYWIVDKKEGFE